MAAVALDLAEDPDPRSAEAGSAALRSLDRERVWSASTKAAQ